MENINMPITIRRSTFMNGLTDLINQSGLPFFVIEDVLKNMLSTVHTMADKQLKQDIEMYEKNLKRSQDVSN